MSETGRFSHHEQVKQIKTEIFGRFAAILYDGKYYPAKDGQPAEVVDIVPQLGDLATCSTDADQVANPQEIHVTWCRPEQGRHAELWLSPSEIEIKYGEWDDSGNPFDITDRAPIHPEALLELHQAIMDAPS